MIQITENLRQSKDYPSSIQFESSNFVFIYKLILVYLFYKLILFYFRETMDMQAAIRKQRITNTTLSRLNNELNQELQEVMEQRIALEIQLEHLRPFTS